MAEFTNASHEVTNVTLRTTLAAAAKMVVPTAAKPILPVQTGVQAQQEEQSSGMTIFFSLLVLAICIILVHLLIKYRLHFLPESVAVVSLGWEKALQDSMAATPWPSLSNAIFVLVSAGSYLYM